MKVLVTGGCGFLGSHVCARFSMWGWKVVAYDNMSKFETSRIEFGNQTLIRNYNKEFLAKLGIETIVADICDKKTLESQVRDCSFIVNCAAQPTMTLSAVDPELDFDTNARGTLNLLEMARKYDIPFATCSTIHIYGTGINDSLRESGDHYIRDPMLIDENAPILTGHLTPLHASKSTSESYVRAYADTYDVRAAAFRLTGIYGPRQFGSEDHGWVSLMAIKTLLGLPIQLIGTGKQVRDIIYVDDAVQAFATWFDNKCPSGVYNICGGKNNFVSVLQVIEKFAQIFKTKQTILRGGARAGDLLYFVGSYEKAQKEFGWRPTVLPDVGLRRFAEWLQANKNVFNV